MAYSLANTHAILSTQLSRVEDLKGYSLEIHHIPADAKNREGTNKVEITTFVLPIITLKELKRQVDRVLEEHDRR